MVNALILMCSEIPSRSARYRNSVESNTLILKTDYCRNSSFAIVKTLEMSAQVLPQLYGPIHVISFGVCAILTMFDMQ